MSFTRLWVVGVLPDEEVARLWRESSAELVFGRPDAERADALAWWTARNGQEPFFVPGRYGPEPTPDALRLEDVLTAMRAEDDLAHTFKGQLLHLVPEQDGVGLFYASVRKGDPAAALVYALGPEAMSRLPGRCGDFLLGAAGVRAALPGVEAVLAPAPERRAEVEQCIEDWHSGMTDGGAGDFDGLVDGPLRVFRHAAEHGLGAVGMTLYY